MGKYPVRAIFRPDAHESRKVLRGGSAERILRGISIIQINKSGHFDPGGLEVVDNLTIGFFIECTDVFIADDLSGGDALLHPEVWGTVDIQALWVSTVGSRGGNKLFGNRWEC